MCKKKSLLLQLSFKSHEGAGWNYIVGYNQIKQMKIYIKNEKHAIFSRKVKNEKWK